MWMMWRRTSFQAWEAILEQFSPHLGKAQIMRDSVVQCAFYIHILCIPPSNFI